MAQSKTGYVADTQNTVNDTPMSLALRQLRANLGAPVFWVINAVAIFLTAMAGPYFTLERLSFPERLVYWGITIAFSTMQMTFLSAYAYRRTESGRWNWALVSALAGMAGVLPVVGLIYLAEGVATGFAEGWRDMDDFTTLLLYVSPSLIAVTMVVNLIITLQQPDPVPAEPATQISAKRGLAAPTLLQGRLPHHLGHDIVSVQAQDHYVEVTTAKGSAMVLMRLRDVVQDLEPLGGLQVHRSWWVNLSHVLRTEKGPSGPQLVLTTGQRVMVGRSFRSALREAMQG